MKHKVVSSCLFEDRCVLTVAHCHCPCFRADVMNTVAVQMTESDMPTLYYFLVTVDTIEHVQSHGFLASESFFFFFF